MSSPNDDFVTAVLLAMNPDQSTPSTAAALAYVDRLKASPDAWQLALSQLHLLTLSSGPPQVLFFCLQLLSSFASSPAYPALPSPPRQQLCSSLLIFLRDVLPSRPPPPFLRSKIASLLCLLLRADYPEKWPSFFTDLLSLLSLSPVLVDIFLRLLRTIDQEVVVHDWKRTEDEVARNLIVKDSVRAGKDMGLIMQAVYSVLSSLRDKREHEELILSALDVTKEYVGWIDVSLIANERWMGLLYELIGREGYEAYRAAALACVVEVYDKKMEAGKKVDLVVQFRVIDMLTALPLTRLDAEAAKEYATLVNCIGTQLLSSSPDPRIEPLVESIMTLAYACLESCPFTVIADSDLLELIKQFIRHLTSSPSLLPSHTQHARRIFSALASAMLYPSSFNFDNPSDEDEAFVEFRSSLHVVFCNLVPAMPDLCVEMVGERLSSIVSRWREEEWQRVEGALRLFYDIGEALKGGVNARILSDPMSSMIASVLSSGVSGHAHHSVPLIWMLIVYRYTRWLEAHFDFVPSTLSSFLDHRGIHHPHPKVRSKACYLLYKLLLSFPDGLRKSLRPHVDVMLQQVQPVVDAGLKGEGGGVSVEDSNYLCEVMGILVSSSVTGDACAGYVTLVLSFLSAHLQSALASSASWPPASPRGSPSSTQEEVGARVALLFDSFGSVSKPLSKEAAKVGDLFDRCFVQTLQLFALLPSHEGVRQKTIFVIHRMVECQGVRMLTHLPVALPSLISYSTPQNFHSLLPLINQILISFKTAFCPLLDAHFLSICSKALDCLSHYSYIDADSTSAYSTDRQERLLLQQRYYQFLKVVLTEAPQIVTSSSNAGGLRKVIESIMRGWESRDGGVEKTCIQCVSLLVKHLQANGGLTDGSPHHQWVTAEVTPAIYSLLFSPYLSLTDANGFSTFREVCQLQWLLLSTMSSAYAEQVGGWLMGRGWTQDGVKEWMGRLQAGDMGKLKELVQGMKGSGENGGKRERMNGGNATLHPPRNGGSNANGAILSRSASRHSSSQDSRTASHNAASSSG